jgi:hypothetical protein
MRFAAPCRVQDRTTIVYITTVYAIIAPVLPPALLQKILTGENSTISATQSLGLLLAGIDQFAAWESSWSDFFLWWVVSLRGYWFWIELAFLFLSLSILIIVLIILPW